MLYAYYVSYNHRPTNWIFNSGALSVYPSLSCMSVTSGCQNFLCVCAEKYKDTSLKNFYHKLKAFFCGFKKCPE